MLAHINTHAARSHPAANAGRHINLTCVKLSEISFPPKYFVKRYNSHCARGGCAETPTRIVAYPSPPARPSAHTRSEPENGLFRDVKRGASGADKCVRVRLCTCARGGNIIIIIAWLCRYGDASSTWLRASRMYAAAATYVWWRVLFLEMYRKCIRIFTRLPHVHVRAPSIRAHVNRSSASTAHMATRTHGALQSGAIFRTRCIAMRAVLMHARVFARV